MTAGRIVLWRHGRTAHNDAGRIQGSTDIPLDPTGLTQAELAAGELAALAPAVIVASDLSRAHQTAQALGRVTGVQVRVDARLRERAFGQWEGLAIGEVLERWPIEAAAWRRGQDVPSVGMETRSAAAARFAAAVTDAALPMDDDATLVVASHGGVIVCGLSALLGLDPVQWHGLRVMGNAEWAVLEVSQHASSLWRLRSYGVAARQP